MQGTRTPAYILLALNYPAASHGAPQACTEGFRSAKTGLLSQVTASSCLLDQDSGINPWVPGMTLKWHGEGHLGWKGGAVAGSARGSRVQWGRGHFKVRGMPQEGLKAHGAGRGAASENGAETMGPGGE